MAKNKKKPVKNNTQGYTSKDTCCLCGNILTQKGALLWSPPDKDSLCKKDYVCVECYKNLH